MGRIFLTLLCLFVMAVFASAQDTKPTRELIIKFLGGWRYVPITDKEKEWKERTKVDLVKQFGTDFTGLDLSGIDFIQTDASGADFSHCNMRNGCFSYTRLDDCNFSNADLTGAKFCDCEFVNANFSHVRLHQTYFLYGKMQNASFVNPDATTSEFSYVDFSEAKLSNTDFSQAACFQGSGFQNADLSNANFSNASLLEANFQNANLKNTNFSNANLHLADFSGANLEGTNFDGTNLYAATFTDVKGIDDAQRKLLEKRSARWHYDFMQVVSGTVYGTCVWLLILSPLWVGIATVIFFVLGLRSKEEKTRLFILAGFLNGFPLFVMSLMLLTAWGAMSIWDWVSLMPMLAFGLLICVLLSLLSVILALVLFWKQRNSRPWQSFLYQVLTFVHCLLVFIWLCLLASGA